jgi:pimeloyl-ACP methyl ester carboxylesterase
VVAEWQTRIVQLGAAPVTVLEAGEGEPLLILHDELGAPRRQAWHAELAKTRRLILPLIPGFASPRLPWVRGVRDVAVLMGQLLRELELGQVDAIGISFGGWLAAEMAVQNPTQFRRLVLVAPFGLKPSEGVIADMFLMSSAEYIRASFADAGAVEEFSALFGEAGPEQIEAWEDARIECAQLGWQPYMHEPAMGPLLAAAGPLPVLVVWGDADAIVPEAAVRAYAQGLPSARLEVMHGCGHKPELERPKAFLKAVSQFLPAGALATA